MESPIKEKKYIRKILPPKPDKYKDSSKEPKLKQISIQE